MKLSIIIPVYNTEKYLKDCLTSIYNKEEQKVIEGVEIILVDDGSTDKSSNIYSRFEKYSNFKIFKNENHGVSYSRNFAIKKATGDWIMFLDSDDMLCEDWYEKIYNNIDEKQDIIFYMNNVDAIKSKKDMIDNILGVKKELKYASFPGAKLFKREFLEKNKIEYNAKIINGEDMLFNLEAILSTDKIKMLNYSIYKYRYNIYSSTKRFNEKIFESDKEFQNELLKIFSAKKMKKEEAIQYSDFCIKNAIYLFIYRLSLVKNTKIKHYFSIFEEEPYSKMLKKHKIHNLNDIVLYFVKIKKYNLAIKLLKLKNYIKRTIILKNRKEILEQV